VRVVHAQADGDKGIKELQGKWRAVEIQTAGISAPKEVLEKARLDIRDDEWIWLSGGPVDVKSRIRLDPSKSPKEIDITMLDGGSKGSTFPGIYALEKGQLRICASHTKDRPKEFKTARGQLRELLILEREKPRPMSVLPPPPPSQEPPKCTDKLEGKWVLGPVAEPRLMAQQPLVAAAAKQDTTPDIKKFAQAQDAAAHKAYDIAVHSLKNGVPGAKPEDVHTWSVRRLKARRELSSKPAEHIAALSAHRKRMQELAKIVDQLVKVGAPGLPLGSAAAADFYVAEAELMLAIAARGAPAGPKQGASEAQGRLEQEKARTEHQRLRAETARYALQVSLALAAGSLAILDALEP